MLLAVLLTGNPGGVGSRARTRRLSLALALLLVAAALWSTAILVHDLINGSGVTNSAAQLLGTGAVIWLGNDLSFALFYWLMDSRGPIMRSRNLIPGAFAFIQQMSPELAPAGWRPLFLDYLHLGFTNATAFSPTDVLPLTYRAKYAMPVQSTVALARSSG